jgi:hypothetical protein
MPKPREYILNKNYNYRPSELSIVQIDGEYLLLGPIIYALMQDNGVRQQTVLDITNCDRRTFRDFIHGKQTKRLCMGIGVVSQIMHAANITTDDIVSKSREMRLCGTATCIKPPPVADLRT